jgi:hypothetical protein
VHLPEVFGRQVKVQVYGAVPVSGTPPDQAPYSSFVHVSGRFPVQIVLYGKVCDADRAIRSPGVGICVPNESVGVQGAAATS